MMTTVFVSVTTRTKPSYTSRRLDRFGPGKNGRRSPLHTLSRTSAGVHTLRPLNLHSLCVHPTLHHVVTQWAAPLPPAVAICGHPLRGEHLALAMVLMRARVAFCVYGLDHLH